MQTLRETIMAARDAHRGVGHFNVSDSNQFNAVVSAAQNVQLPVIIGVSEGERKFIGIHNVVAMVKSAREQGMQVYLNGDHTYSVEGVKEAIDAGFDAVIFDGSALSYEENVAKAKECVAYARATGRDVIIEGEIGRIGTSSKILDAVPENVDKVLTSPEQALQFVIDTGIDLLAPAVGTMHGILRSGEPKQINVEQVGKIAAAVQTPMVLHGGSSSTDEGFRGAVKAGIAVVHVNTDIRVAYRKGIEVGLAANPDEIAPYRYLAPGVDGVRTVVERYLKLFAGQ